MFQGKQVDLRRGCFAELFNLLNDLHDLVNIAFVSTNNHDIQVINDFDVHFEVIDDLNVMIIRGNERDVDQIMKVIKQIEQLSEATAPEVNLLPLEHVDAESLAELLTSVYEKLTKFPGRATQPRKSVAIIPVSKPNSLLIVAPGAEIETILDLADKLDKPVDPQTEFQVFSLKSAIASDVETMITEFYKERKALGAKVLVIADSRSNSVIVRARPRRPGRNQGTDFQNGSR